MMPSRSVVCPAPDPSLQPCETPAFSVLSAEAELTLVRRWHVRHDCEAAHILVSNSLRIAVEIAAAYSQRYAVRTDDLIGECYVALMRTLSRFDPEGGSRFAEHAACRMHAAVQELILRNWSRRDPGTDTAQLDLLATLRRTHRRMRELEGQHRVRGRGHTVAQRCSL